jgi:hypothetical protein
MSGDAFLPAVSTSTVFLGGYDATNKWPNPIKTTSTGITGMGLNSLTYYSHNTPETTMAGDVGQIQYYSWHDGIHQYNAINKLNWGEIFGDYAIYKARFDAFEALKTTYEVKRVVYDNAINAEITRNTVTANSIF